MIEFLSGVQTRSAIQPVERADRIAAHIAHGADPETALAIAAPVVEAVVREVRSRGAPRASICTAFRIEEMDARPGRREHAAAGAETRCCRRLSASRRAVNSPVPPVSMRTRLTAGAAAVDPVEALARARPRSGTLQVGRRIGRASSIAAMRVANSFFRQRTIARMGWPIRLIASGCVLLLMRQSWHSRRLYSHRPIRPSLVRLIVPFPAGGPAGHIRPLRRARHERFNSASR